MAKEMHRIDREKKCGVSDWCKGGAQDARQLTFCVYGEK